MNNSVFAHPSCQPAQIQSICESVSNSRVKSNFAMIRHSVLCPCALRLVVFYGSVSVAFTTTVPEGTSQSETLLEALVTGQKRHGILSRQKQRIGFWGPPTSAIDWCEDNYVRSHYVAEFHNTWTNTFFVGVAIAILNRCHRQGLPAHFKFGAGCMVLTGAFSGLFHATLWLSMQRLDEVQRHFLDEIRVDQQRALLYFNLVPLGARRDIAMLAVIHRTVLGKGPDQFREFFRAEARPHFPRSLRAPGLRHSRQLHDPSHGSTSNPVRRSALSLIYTYNLLPQAVVDRPSLPSFQRLLQNGLKRACEGQLESWEQRLRNGAQTMQGNAFQNLFQSPS